MHESHEMHPLSIDAYRLIGFKGITQENERRVYAYLLAHPFSTCNEIKAGLGEVDRNRVAPRLSNLRKAHWVVGFTSKRDPVTGCRGDRYVALSEAEHNAVLPVLPNHRSRAYEMGKRHLKTLNLAPVDYEVRISALAAILGI